MSSFLLALPFTSLARSGISFRGLFGDVFMFKRGVSSLSVWMRLHSNCFVPRQCHCYDSTPSYNTFLKSLFAVSALYKKTFCHTEEFIAQETVVDGPTIKLQ